MDKKRFSVNASDNRYSSVYEKLGVESPNLTISRTNLKLPDIEAPVHVSFSTHVSTMHKETSSG